MTRKSERGQATVEFALSVTLFLMLLFALFDIGRLVYLDSALTAAAQEGARILVAHPTMSTSRLRVEMCRKVVGLNPSDIQVNVRWRRRNTVEVEATHRYHSIVPLPFFDGLLLRARVRMHVELGR